jgi:hypothetical protein
MLCMYVCIHVYMYTFIYVCNIFQKQVFCILQRLIATFTQIYPSGLRMIKVYCLFVEPHVDSPLWQTIQRLCATWLEIETRENEHMCKQKTAGLLQRFQVFPEKSW